MYLNYLAEMCSMCMLLLPIKIYVHNSRGSRLCFLDMQTIFVFCLFQKIGFGETQKILDILKC